MEGTPTEDTRLALGGTLDRKLGADPDLRFSVFGYNYYYCEALIACKSKAGHSVTLSSTEVEYVALSEITNDIICVKEVLDTMLMKLNLPFLLKVDNGGATCLSNNQSLSQQTKHIDIWCHFVREFVEVGAFKTIFVVTDNNDADIHTKHTPEATFGKRRDKNMEDVYDKLKQ
jgi:hypothetical protein